MLLLAKRVLMSIMLGLLASSAALAAESSPSWEKILAAAKKEGKLVVIGPNGTDVRDALTQGFQKKYPEIQVDFNGMSGAMVAPKLLNELAASYYRTDLVVGGTTSAIGYLMPAKALKLSVATIIAITTIVINE